MIWIFREPGCIPGVPGQFASCQVEIREDGFLDVQPLAQPPGGEPPVEVPTEEQEPEPQAEAE